MDTILKVETSHQTASITDIINGFKSQSGTLTLRSFEFEFYNRFAPYVYKVAVENSRSLNDCENIAKDILQLTFIKAFEKIKDYEFPNYAVTEERRCISLKAWLGTIANRIFLKTIAKECNEHLDIESIDIPARSPYFADAENEVETTNENHLRLQDALSKLSEEDRLIVLTYANEGCINSTSHISPGALDFLCKSLNTNSGTIRKRKQRALEKLNSMLFPS